MPYHSSSNFFLFGCIIYLLRALSRGLFHLPTASVFGFPLPLKRPFITEARHPFPYRQLAMICRDQGEEEKRLHYELLAAHLDGVGFASKNTASRKTVYVIKFGNEWMMKSIGVLTFV